MAQVKAAVSLFSCIVWIVFTAIGITGIVGYVDATTKGEQPHEDKPRMAVVGTVGCLITCLLSMTFQYLTKRRR